MPRIIRKNL